MACVALSSLMATIELEFLQPIPRVSLHDQTTIKTLLETLSNLQAVMEKNSGGNAAIRDLDIKIRNFALKVEDNIEIQLSNFLGVKDSEFDEKATQEPLCQTLREAEEKAAELLKKITNFIINEPKKSDESSLRLPEIEHRMFGRSQEYGEIKRLLINRSWSVAIVGMMGIGKTTLAKAVFEDSSVVCYFDIRGWVTISEEQNKRQILCDLLRSITSAADQIIKESILEDILSDWVRRILMGRRYLIVLDNIWTVYDWTDIQVCLPDKYGSCILITTRNLQLARYVSHHCHPYQMNLLHPKESWDLFRNILSPKKYMRPQLQKIKSDIVEKCDGLPLLIVTVAKRLSKCNNIEQGWKKIEKELESLGIIDRNALNSNYNQLPQRLKVCFLYFGVFPKRKEVSIKVLIRLWIAEGFVKSSEEHGHLENQAFEYLQELADFNLVLMVKRSNLDGRFKTCRMHSAWHTFCVGEAQKEGIFCAVNTQQHLGLPLADFANSCRWLSLYKHSFDYYVLFSTNNPRSVFLFDENPETFVPLKLLRVLAFVPSSFLQRVSIRSGDLVFLRYLSITQWFEGLDYLVSRMSNLQTLVVSSNDSQPGASTRHLPSGIWNSSQLRHLELGNSYTVDPPRVVKENLQTLSWMCPTPWSEEVYFMLPNTRKLKIFVKDDIEPSRTLCFGYSCNNPIVLDSLHNLHQLEKLTISISDGCVVTLPERCMFPSKLKKLRLCGTNLSGRDLNVIGMLPNLEVLKLENVFSEEAVWEADENGFIQLKFLLLEDNKLKQLKASGDSFPKLEHLVLRSCDCLNEIPIGFSESFYLLSIELVRCHPSLVASAKQIVEELEDFGCEVELKIQD